MKKILVTGAGGYVGSVLVPKLLLKGYFVRALDLYMYEMDPWEGIPKNHKAGKLEYFRGDIRNEKILEFALQDIDTVIHLACISNDPSFDLDPRLGRSINLDAFQPLVKMCVDNGVQRFINASSSSVYGVSEDPEVTEQSKCLPLTDYSKFKLETESILKSYGKFLDNVSVRSATVCGYSPRQRLDVIVNIMTNHAFSLGEITVMGGEQKRPNIHIDDITEFYLHLVDEDVDKIDGEVFNYGGPNYTVEELCRIVRIAFFPKTIGRKVMATNDPRSYSINSDKAKKTLGMAPKKTIKEAVFELKEALESGKLPNSMSNPKYFNIEMMKVRNLR